MPLSPFCPYPSRPRAPGDRFDARPEALAAVRLFDEAEGPVETADDPRGGHRRRGQGAAWSSLGAFWKGSFSRVAMAGCFGVLVFGVAAAAVEDLAAMELARVSFATRAWWVSENPSRGVGTLWATLTMLATIGAKA